MCVVLLFIGGVGMGLFVLVGLEVVVESECYRGVWVSVVGLGWLG